MSAVQAAAPAQTIFSGSFGSMYFWEFIFAFWKLL